jgi:hypothetical protein
VSQDPAVYDSTFHAAAKLLSDRLSSLLGATVTVTAQLLKHYGAWRIQEIEKEVGNGPWILLEDQCLPSLHQTPAGTNSDTESVGYPISLLAGLPAGKLNPKQAEQLTALLSQGTVDPIIIPVFFFQSGVVQEVHVDPVDLAKMLIRLHLDEKRRWAEAIRASDAAIAGESRFAATRTGA